jgi:CspA family cold shock protein
MRGVVKWFTGQRFFGFIAGDDGRDYFVHGSAAEAPHALTGGVRVAFDVVPDARCPRAVRVRRID